MNLYFNGPNSAFNRDNTLQDYLKDIKPSYASSGTTDVRMLIMQFGDGYSQRAPDGINNTPRKFALTFRNRSKEVIDAIENFLLGKTVIYNERLPHEYFFWTPPEPFEQTEGKFIIDGKLERTPVSGGMSTLNVNLTEVFDP